MGYDFFNKEAFMAEVLQDTAPKYGVENPCTIFYEAQDKVVGLAAPSEPECWKLILTLGNRAFSSIWGLKKPDGTWIDEGAIEYADAHKNDEFGCTTCGDKWHGCTFPDLAFKARQMGMQYYAILLNLQNVVNKVKELEAA